ncbi:hypothetical protein, partial [Acinetobacter rudis]
MKHKIILATMTSFLLNTSSFADENENFFVAYSSAQAANIPRDLKAKMLLPTNLDTIAIKTLNNMGLNELSRQYLNQPELQQKLRTVIQNYINSSAADSIFDDKSTQLFSDIYTVDELKSLYQLNNTKNGKLFNDNNSVIDKKVQSFIDISYRQQFNQAGFEKLEADIKTIVDKVKPSNKDTELETIKVVETLNSNESKTVGVSQAKTAVETKVAESKVVEPAAVKQATIVTTPSAVSTTVETKA